MHLQDTLTKENFWNGMMEKYPKATKEFCQWIDEYKKEVAWDVLFSTTDGFPKFHDIPHAMQQGIWIAFCKTTLDNYFEQPEYMVHFNWDLEEDIETVFKELEPLIDE